MKKRVLHPTGNRAFAIEFRRVNSVSLVTIGITCYLATR